MITKTRFRKIERAARIWIKPPKPEDEILALAKVKIQDEIDISDSILVMQCFYRNSIVSLKQPASNGNLDLSRPIRLDLRASPETLTLYVPKKSL